MRVLLCLILFVAVTVQAQSAPPEVTAPTANELAMPEAPTAVTAKTNANLKETEIPVNLESGKKAASSESPLFKIIAGLVGVVLLVFGGVIFLRRYMQNSGEMKSAPQIKILTQHYLGPKKHLAIVRVAGESILIGITEHNISMLKSLSLLDDEVPEETPANFNGVFASKTSATNAANTDEEFSISGIKDFVSNRLKDMRSLE